jgi:predicted enzyme related to lactoylglutathione lyase
MLRGLTTVSYFADDVAAAAAWYAELLRTDPYFARPVEGPPQYVEFRIGDYQHELGIVDSRFSPHGPTTGAAGAVMYWHVDDVATTLDKLLAMGATPHDEIRERGAGFVTASVLDPFGNILGIMYNPHYLEVLRSLRSE